jgi:MFS family permease
MSSLRQRFNLSHAAGFWTVAAAFVAVMAVAAVPTPLYVLYEQQDHFSGLVVTVIFAVYAVGVIASLFLAGHVSDWLGRRRVLVPAVLLSAMSAGIFIVWPELPGLLVARFVSGLAAGAMTATATAYLADLHAARGSHRSGRRAELVATAANLGGIGFGPLSAGLLAQFLPDPLVIPYVVFGVLALVLALAARLAPETAGVEDRPPYRMRRISVPAVGRRRFLAAAVGGLIAFSVFGLFTSLAPSFLAGTLGQPSHALAGLAAFLVFGSGALSQSLLARVDARRLSAAGLTLLPVGLVVVTAATWVPSLAAFLVGGVLAGAGAGLLVKGGIDTVLDIAPPELRAEVLAAFFLASYLGLSAPIVGLGLATQYISARVSLIGFAGVMVLALAAAAPVLLGGTRRSLGTTEIKYQGASS